jgi:large subunit ribosomal protein L9
MKVILLEDVESLGDSGELVDVKPGYGRNFLLPRRLAVLANPKNLRQLEHQKAESAARQAKTKAAALELAKKVEAVTVKLARKVGEQDKLFGSVTALDVAEGLAKAGVQLDRHVLKLKEPIKAVGQYEVPAALHKEVVAKIKVEVVAE